MAKALSQLSCWWGRNSSQEKDAQGVVRDQYLRDLGRDKTDSSQFGYKIAIDMSLRDGEALERWRRVDAVYIPTNRRDLLRQDVALAMGHKIEDGDVVKMFWKVSIEPHNYDCWSMFSVESGLPCEVIFGKKSPQDATTFETGKRLPYDESYDFSKSRTNSWGRIKETLSWSSSGSDEKKVKSRRRSLLSRKSQSSYNTASTSKAPTPSMQAQGVKKVRSAGEETAYQNLKDRPNVPSTEPETERTAKLSTEHSTRLEDRRSQTFDSGCIIDSSLNEGVSGLKNIPSEAKIQEEGNDREIDVTGEKPHGRACTGDWQQTNSNAESKDGFSLHSQNAHPDITNEYVSSLSAVESERPFHLAADTRVGKPGSNPRLEGHVQQRQVLELKQENDAFSLPSTNYAPSSLETEVIPSTAPESPMSRDNMTSLTERYPESALDNTLQNDLPSKSGKDITQERLSPVVAKDSDLLLIQQEARAEVRARKRGKTPKVRRKKSDQKKASEDVDLQPLPGANEHWTYDPAAKGHYHVDSDTGSAIWYSDSESDSDD